MFCLVAALTPISSRTPSSQWVFHGKLLFLDSAAERSVRYPGRRCTLAWVDDIKKKKKKVTLKKTLCQNCWNCILNDSNIGKHKVLRKSLTMWWYLYLWLGWGQSDPYSWTCIPKKQTSAPSMSSNAKRALVLYGNDSDISPLSTNLETKARVNTGAVNKVNLYKPNESLYSQMSATSW